MAEVMEIPTKQERRINTEYTERVIENSLSTHKEFDRKWGKESYHNQEHIKAALKGVEKIVEKAKQGVDPLNLQKSLDKWNDDKGYVGDERIDIDMFLDIAKQAFAGHDKGNIMNEDESYLDGYVAAGAEDRAKEIFKHDTYTRTDIDKFTQDQYENLGNHLIEKTKFKYMMTEEDFEEPFWQFVVAVDQLANGVYNENPNHVDGLIEEKAFESPSEKDSEYGYFNFNHWRSKMLIPDEEKCKQFYEEVLEIDMPTASENFSKTKMTFEELLEYRKKKREVLDVIKSNPGGLSSQTEKEVEKIIKDNEELEKWYNSEMRGLDQFN